MLRLLDLLNWIEKWNDLNQNKYTTDITNLISTFCLNDSIIVASLGDEKWCFHYHLDSLAGGLWLLLAFTNARYPSSSVASAEISISQGALAQFYLVASFQIEYYPGYHNLSKCLAMDEAIYELKRPTFETYV